MSELSFKLEVFEGPLDLLLSLISKNKVDIYDIPIALILEQYMDYLEQMRLMDMEIAGEFIVMAADLMLIKSKMLLPKQIDEETGEVEDPRAQLARALLEYKRAKEAASYLSGQYSLYAGRLAKETEVIDRRGEIPDHIDMDLLTRAFERVLSKNSHLPDLMKESEKAIERLLAQKIVPVSAKIITMMKYLLRHGPSDFEDILCTAKSRSELVAMFIGTLELIKVQRVTISADPDTDRVFLTLQTHHKRTESIII